MTLERDGTAEFVERVDLVLDDARATRATLAETDRMLAQELVARRHEMLQQLRENTYGSHERAT